jgi:hypothetical protein
MNNDELELKADKIDYKNLLNMLNYITNANLSENDGGTIEQGIINQLKKYENIIKNKEEKIKNKKKYKL